MKEKIVIHWFRQDLRLSDNPAFTAAANHNRILPIYILDNENAGEYEMGGASKWWLHHSLSSLSKSLNGNLSLYKGNPQNIIDGIMTRFEVEAVYWNRCYEPWRINRDTQIKEHLKKMGVDVYTSNSSLLWEPWNITKKDGTPYRVFTPFYRKGCLQAEQPREPLSIPKGVDYICDDVEQLGINDLNLLPKIGWDNTLASHWNIGEKGAKERLGIFINEGLAYYSDGRNVPSKPYVSRLSPHVHFGEVSPNQLWYALQSIADNKDIDVFCSELGWREFSYSQLYYNPDLPVKNLQSKFDDFLWVENEEYLCAWQKGQTGIPMVDAGMRELWQTGYMHNRVRMIVGSFLVKNLRLHWRHGERWFWDTLVDADLASNSASWQWIAGCGFDASPYFRIFNPVIQGQKFDPDGDYVRKYIPEIARLPNKNIFSPWEASAATLKSAGIELGQTYPRPIVDLRASRQGALDAFKFMGKDYL